MSNTQPEEKATSRRSRAAAKVKRRPAEIAGATGSLAGVVIAIAAGDQVAIGTAVAGLVPAAWTFCKLNGGIVGVIKIILFGRGDDGGDGPTSPDTAPATA
jgi:hypothetical protein